MQSLIQDLHSNDLEEVDRPLIQRHDNFYQPIRYRQDGPLSHCLVPSTEDDQAAAKAQDLLHLQVLNEMGERVQGNITSIGNDDIDDLLARQCDIRDKPPGEPDVDLA